MPKKTGIPSLAYRSAYGGGLSREDYYLCSDGSFMQNGGT